MEQASSTRDGGNTAAQAASFALSTRLSTKSSSLDCARVSSFLLSFSRTVCRNRYSFDRLDLCFVYRHIHIRAREKVKSQRRIALRNTTGTYEIMMCETIVPCSLLENELIFFYLDNETICVHGEKSTLSEIESFVTWD